MAKTIEPGLLLGAHVVLDFIFYNGKQFPKEYQGGVFAAFHGSWNRAQRVGQTVVYIPFKNGTPAGEIREFLSCPAWRRQTRSLGASGCPDPVVRWQRPRDRRRRKQDLADRVKG